ncbi:MAG: hypothetical protein IKC80_06775, partial [Kiritimatiellae bacterium]|nr:hypothetical protein [Kiritimatiellia bacterium]
NGGQGEMTVKSGGVYGCVNADYAMIVANGAAGTLNVQGGDVFLGGPLHLSRTAHASAVNVTDGGVLAFSRIEYGESAEGGAAALTIDGGTVRAGASNAAFIPGSQYLTVAVGENGATIDNAGYDITIARPISGTGPLALIGSGTTTLDISSSAIPALSATTLTLPEAGTVSLTYNGGAFPEGIYMICKTDGASAADGEKFSPSTGALAYTWSVDNGVLLLTVGEPAVNCTWTGLAGDGLFSTPGNWLLGKKPETGSAEPIVFGGASSSITNDIGELSPSSIVFQAGISALTLSGHAISGVHAISNLSYSASVTFLSPVSFAEGEPIEVYHTATYADTLTYSNADGMIFFKGGVTGYEVRQNTTSGRSNIYAGEYHRTSTASDFMATKGGAYRNIVYKNSSLTVDTAADIWELGVEEGGAFTSRVITVRQDGAYNRLSWRNDGEIVATEEMILTATGNNAGYLSLTADASKGNVFKAQKLVMAGSDWVRLSNKSSDVGTTTVFVGEGGIVFNDSGSRFSTGKLGNQSGKTTIRPWRGNFEIGERSGTAHSIAVNKATVFNTDNEAGEGQKITVNASLDNTYAVSIAGSGIVRYNRANDNSGALTVAGSATLELGAGAKTGKGAVTVNKDATLSVPEEGTGTVGGKSTFESGGCLSFVLNSNDDRTKLELSDTFTAPASGTISVKVSAAAGFMPRSLEPYTLLSGGKVTCAASKFAFVDAPSWADRLAVENGNLVLYTKRPGLSLIVR